MTRKEKQAQKMMEATGCQTRMELDRLIQDKGTQFFNSQMDRLWAEVQERNQAKAANQ